METWFKWTHSNGIYITSMRNSTGDNIDGKIRVKLVLPPAVAFLWIFFMKVAEIVSLSIAALLLKVFSCQVFRLTSLCQVFRLTSFCQVFRLTSLWGLILSHNTSNFWAKTLLHRIFQSLVKLMTLISKFVIFLGKQFGLVFSGRWISVHYNWLVNFSQY